MQPRIIANAATLIGKLVRRLDVLSDPEEEPYCILEQDLEGHGEKDCGRKAELQ